MAGRDASGCIDPYEELERQESERRDEERAAAPYAETTRKEERHAGRGQREREVAANAPLSRTGTGKRRAPYPVNYCLLYTSPSPRDQRGSRMPSSA